LNPDNLSPPADALSSFADLGLIEPLLRAVAEEGYARPMPIQQRAIPHVLAGKDLMGCAQTGTGKTAAFALPILQRLVSCPRRRGHGHHVIRALVVTPTRELATQIGESFSVYGRHTDVRNTVIFGGVRQAIQTRALHRGVDVLVATPGRLLDLYGQGLVRLRGLDVFVLDEADRMLDMGFIPDVRRIAAALPEERQTLFFSATMPANIERLAGSMVRDPVRVEAAPTATTVDSVEQRLFFVAAGDKRSLLEHLLRTDPEITRALVFCRTKHGAERVARHLRRAGFNVQSIHGNKAQAARERALDRFRTGRARVLVATDIAARGIDIESISHVINYDLPDAPESYVHRIGRTARAGASGTAFSLCGLEEIATLGKIEKLIRKKLTAVNDHPYVAFVSKRSQPQGEEQARGTRRKRLLRGVGRRRRRMLR
jgi:ATP-dependent RNA helicase RhlE